MNYNIVKKIALFFTTFALLRGSVGFMLPHSYQCNLMVYGAGGYRTSDFFKFGFFCQLWLVLAVILIVYFGQINQNIMLIVSLVAAAMGLVFPFVRPLVQFLFSGARHPLKRKGSFDLSTS